VTIQGQLWEHCESLNLIYTLIINFLWNLFDSPWVDSIPAGHQGDKYSPWHVLTSDEHPNQSDVCIKGKRFHPRDGGTLSFTYDGSLLRGIARGLNYVPLSGSLTCF